MGEATLKILSDASAVERELQRTTARVAQLESALRTAAANSAAMNREEARMAGEARRVLAGLETPLEQHQQALQRIERLYVAGRLSVEQFNAAKAQEVSRFQRSTDAYKAAAAEQERIVGLRQRSAESAARTEREQAAAAQRLLAGSATPKQSHHERLRQIQELRAAGQLTDDQARRAHLEEIRRYQQSTPAYRAQQDAKRQAAAEDAQLAARGRQLWADNRTALERYQARMAEYRQLLRAGKIDQETFARAAAKARAEAEEQPRGDGGWLAGLARNAASAAAGYLSLRAAIQLATAALEHKRTIEREAATANETLADAQREFNINLSAASDEEMTAANRRVEQLASESLPVGGVKTAYQVASAALSGSGGQQDLAMESARIALKLSPTNAQTAQQVAAVLPDVAQITGEKTGEANLGYMLAIGRQAVSTDQQQVSQYLVPTAKSLAAKGATPEQAGAMVTGFQKALGQRDREGRLTATAMTQFAEQAEKFLPEKDEIAYGVDIRTGQQVPKGIARKGTGMKTVWERMQFLQRDQAARERFLAEASFEAPTKLAMQELLGQGEARTKKNVEANLKDFAPRATWDRLGRDQLERLDRPFAQRASAAERAVDAAAERQATGTAAGQQASLSDVLSADAMEKVLKASGQSYIPFTADQFAFSADELLGGEAEERFRRLGMDRVRAMRTEQVRIEYQGSWSGPTYRDVQTSDPVRLEAARQMERSLNDILDRYRAAREAIPRPEAPPKPQATSGPAAGDQASAAADPKLRDGLAAMNNHLEALRGLQQETLAALRSGDRERMDLSRATARKTSAAYAGAPDRHREIA